MTPPSPNVPELITTGKKAGQDKQLYYTLENQYKEEMSRSPKESILSASPFGPMTFKRSRETLIDLISVLNASFPDYDFRFDRTPNFPNLIFLH